VRILAGFAAVGALLGIAVPLPAFALVLVIILISYGFMGGNDVGLLGRLFDLVLAALALQAGYFVTILVRALILSKSAKRASGSSEDEDTKH
jgi:hypothetical protein